MLPFPCSSYSLFFCHGTFEWKVRCKTTGAESVAVLEVSTKSARRTHTRWLRWSRSSENRGNFVIQKQRGTTLSLINCPTNFKKCGTLSEALSLLSICGIQFSTVSNYVCADPLSCRPLGGLSGMEFAIRLGRYGAFRSKHIPAHDSTKKFMECRLLAKTLWI